MSAIDARVAEVEIVGDVPILLHSAQTLDPLDEMTKAMKRITSKAKKSDDDIIELRRLEWLAGLYVSGGKICMPFDNLHACLRRGASSDKGGMSLVDGCVFPVDADGSFPIRFDGDKLAMEALYADKRFVLAKRTTVNRKGVFRVRPRIPAGWSITMRFGVFRELTLDRVESWMARAGSRIGLCDWRPRYGRFSVKSFREVKL